MTQQHSPVFQEIARIAAEPVEAASALPFGAYRDRDVFDAEIAQVFERDWVPVCAEVDLAEPGDYYALSVGREPVVVIRGKDGEVRALSNVCRHRGTILLDDGYGNASKITCPYHAWAYSQEGALLGVPHPGSVEVRKDQHTLPSFALERWAGILWVNVAEDVEPLHVKLRGIDRFVERFEIDRYTQTTRQSAPEPWQANWKLIMENGIESYHLFKVHRETLEPFSPTAGAFYVEGSAPWTITAGATSRTIGSDSEPGSIGDFEKNHYVLVSIPPAFVAILTRDSWGWLTVRPTAPDHTMVMGGSLSPGSSMPTDPAVAQAYSDFTRAFLEEDRWICERGQRGMQARRSGGGQLVELERVVADFHRYVAHRITGQKPPARFTSDRAKEIWPD